MPYFETFEGAENHFQLLKFSQNIAHNILEQFNIYPIKNIFCKNFYQVIQTMNFFRPILKF